MARALIVVLGALLLMTALTALIAVSAPLIAGVIIVVVAVLALRIRGGAREINHQPSAPRVSWLDVEFPDGRS